MATAPLKACPVPGCPNRVAKGRCPEHTRQTQHQIDEKRGSFKERGYTQEWRRLSKMRLAEFPMCADPYQVHGELGAFAQCTDHVFPIWAGGELLDESNLQSLCFSCNTRKDADDRRKYAKAPEA